MEDTHQNKLNTKASIRFILTGSCQSGCNFCHLEGNRPAGYSVLHPDISGWKEKDTKSPLLQRLSYPVDMGDVNFVIKLGNLLKIKEVHLTGGEPTLHPQIGQIVETFKKSGFLVDLTTHGEYPTNILEKLFSLGVDGVVFSLHCVNPEDYLTMDLVAQQFEDGYGLEKALAYSKSRLQMKKSNILKCLDQTRNNSSFDVRANHVIRNASTTISVIRFCNDHGLMIRLQRDLSKRSDSDKVLEEIIALLNAKKVSEENGICDSSDGRIVYRYRLKNGQSGQFQVKDFSPIYLPMICQNCELKNSSKCRERFYGIRVQHGKVRLCIDRHDSRTLYDFKSFLENKYSVMNELKKQYNVS